MIEYVIGDSGQALILTDSVLAHFERHRQRTPRSKESGGQLFARFIESKILLERATGPRRTDHRGIMTFIPNRLEERREIRRFFKSGMHYIGDWHTHPEPHPWPSETDMNSFQDMYKKSHHNLASFVMIIVGTATSPEGLFVGLSNDRGLKRLDPIGYR